MMTGDPAEAALMQAVCSQPSEDEPRIAYADWVARNAGDEGAARADFIRRTIRSFRVEQQLEDDTSHDLLTAARKAAWSNGVAALGLNMYHFVRGFVGNARADAATLLRIGNDLAARCPLEYVGVFRGAKAGLAELLRAPWMTHVFSLDLGGNDLTDDDVHLLADSGLSGLRWVNLDDNPVSIKAAEDMAAATAAGRFPELHTLHLPLDIYDDVEGGSGMAPVQMTVFRPDEGTRLRARYGELAWLVPRPPGLRGALHA
jgi:uncharacterized protein (TIGR02996 family)